MTTSLWTGTVRFDDADHDNEEALGVVLARCTMNNLNHLADSCGQVLIASPPAANGDGVLRQSDTLEPTLVAEYGPFPLRIKPDASSYVVRVRLRARLGTAGTVPVFVVLHTSRMSAPSQVVDTTQSHVEEFSLTSTTSAWLTPIGANTLQLGPSWLESGNVDRATLSQLSSGAPQAVKTAEATISVIASESVAKRDVEITGFYAAEFLGV